MLSAEQKSRYNRDGYILLEGVLSAPDLAALRRVTDEFVEKSRQVRVSDDVFDVAEDHSAAHPRLRRIKKPDSLHSEYAKLARHPAIVTALDELWEGRGVRFKTSKLNTKLAGSGEAIEWHQDWAFYPHTNSDLVAVGVMLDDCDTDNGALMVVPGSHMGPIYDHRDEHGVFCGAIHPRNCSLDLAKAPLLTGRAGSMTIHHVRAVHGSGRNFSSRDRKMLFLEYSAADAWPLKGVKDWDEYNSRLLIGTPSDICRMEAVPVRLPYPEAKNQGSIYENQKTLKGRFFETTSENR